MFPLQISKCPSVCAKFAAAFFALTSSVANAGYVENTTVVKVRTTELNTALVFVSTPIINRPACSAGGTEQLFVFDISVPGGKAILHAKCAVGKGDWCESNGCWPGPGLPEPGLSTFSRYRGRVLPRRFVAMRLLGDLQRPDSINLAKSNLNNRN